MLSQHLQGMGVGAADAVHGAPQGLHPQGGPLEERSFQAMTHLAVF